MVDIEGRCMYLALVDCRSCEKRRANVCIELTITPGKNPPRVSNSPPPSAKTSSSLKVRPLVSSTPSH